MEKQEGYSKTIGQAIDELIQALVSLDEGSRITAIRATCEHLKIPLSLTATTTPPPNSGVAPPPSQGQPPSPQIIDIKSLRDEKKPSSANEMAAVVAFYVSELAPGAERKSEVQTEDMVRYFKQAKFELPKQPQMLLTNAKNAGYFDSSGSGHYKLNAVGYNLVAHNLPRGSGEATTPKRSRKSRKRTAPRTKKGRQA